LESLNPDDEAKAWISSFDEKLLIPTTVTLLVPVVRGGGLDALCLTVLGKLRGVTDENREDVKARLRKYCEMFVEVVTVA
jgi:hypothetical protein